MRTKHAYGLYYNTRLYVYLSNCDHVDENLALAFLNRLQNYTNCFWNISNNALKEACNYIEQGVVRGYDHPVIGKCTVFETDTFRGIEPIIIN